MNIKNFMLYAGIITQLTLGSMACTATKSIPRDPLQKGPRKIYVKAAVDEEYSGRYWKDVIKRDIKRSSEIFEKQLGIELILTGIERWDSDDELCKKETIEELKKEVPLENNDIVIGFTRQNYDKHMDKPEYTYWAIAEGVGFGNYILITSELSRRQVISHEVAHLFDADHSPDEKSIMYHRVNSATTFDEKNKKKILKNKYQNFRK